MKIYFLGNYTQTLIADQLKRSARESKLDLDIHVSGFNQFRQQIIDPESEMYHLSPDVVIISIDLFTLTEDIIYKQEGNLGLLLEERLAETLSLFDILCAKLNASQVFVDNFCYYQPVLMHTLEYNSPFGYQSFENRANSKLEETAAGYDNLKVIDLKTLIVEKGASNLIDHRMHYLAKSHWNSKGLKSIAGLYLRYLKAYKGLRKKCIVLDLDNTLWGGVIGDDGIENIKLSNDGEGKAFYDFQRELLKLYKRGIMLAINSKNTEEVVLDAMINHPYMILKPEHFICMKINWENKAQNMKQIAEEINIGLDSLVFLDDSEFEREIISTHFPEIEVPELPKDFSNYPDFIRKLDLFDMLSLTGDDFARNEMYKANVQRDNLKKNVVNIEDFYFSLEMIATINLATPFQVPRIAQMTQKTNQFNLRTIRYTEGDIQKFIKEDKSEVYFLSLADKFGDNGIVGTAIVTFDPESAFIDSFIFSCRALGRTAETALLNFIIDDVKKKGAKRLSGEYIPTKKNMPCRDFYKDSGFEKGEGNTWFIDINKYKFKNLPWIKVNP